jgi:acyl-CoA hydrolase|tara:strand:+ start:124 stop:516 length:393 start_codon:yes stop_codon:yes gene_type:complete
MKYSAKYSQLVMPDDANNVGTLFGGQMISWMDLAAAKVAYRFLQGTGADGALTRAIEKVEFCEPVYPGEWVNFEGYVSKAGNSSFEVVIDAYAEGSKIKKRLACTAIITMVAVKKNSENEYLKTPHGLSL